MPRKILSLYFLLTLPIIVIIIALVYGGQNLPASSLIFEVSNKTVSRVGTAASVQHPLAIMLLQICTVLGSAKILGYLFKRAGQPSVMGEIAAGIFLGPSLLGWCAPDAMAFLFPVASLPNLQLLSQIGLILFMFIIGMEVDADIIKTRALEALVISHVSIVFPYLLGVLLAYILYSTHAPANISFIPYALFMGIAMSITAFPVLARILKERAMTKTPVGAMAILCAAINDLTGWCILPVVIAVARADGFSQAIISIISAAIFLLAMVFIVRPQLSKLSNKLLRAGKPTVTFTAIVFLMLILASLLSEVIGIHALFGAFLAGVIMPNDFSLRHIFTERLEDISVTLLLPLFFAFTGLRTQIGLLNHSHLWVLSAIIIALAVFGKLFGSAVAARLVGQTWRDSWSIGALMNTRGLMELIVLNIGYDLGILSPEIFTIMVFMALITSLMTGPALTLIQKFSNQ